MLYNIKYCCNLKKIMHEGTDASYERDLIKSLVTVGYVCLSRTLPRPLSSLSISLGDGMCWLKLKLFKWKETNIFLWYSKFYNQKPNVCTLSPQRQELDLVLVEHEECEDLNNAGVRCDQLLTTCINTAFTAFSVKWRHIC